MLVLVEVASFGVEPETGEPLVILKAAHSDRTLEIAIGPAEATAIAIKSLNVASEGPLTVDLVCALIRALDGRLDRVVVYDEADGAYLARLHVVAGAAVHVVECSPSDAVAVAMRGAAPIFVEDALLGAPEAGENVSEADTLRKSIASGDTLQFGRYYLE